MRKLFILPVVLLALVGSVAAAYAFDPAGDPGSNPATDPGGQAPPLADETPGPRPLAYVLRVGESFELQDGRKVTFVGLLEDSRCPADAMCAWMGQAVVRLAVAGEAMDLTFTGPESATVDVGGGIALDVEEVQPYPLASQPHDPADAEVTIVLRPGR